MAQRNLRPRKSKSQAQILDELLKRFDKNKKQTDIAEDSMKLSIQTILKQPRRLNLTEFVDEIQIQDSDNEIPVIFENADQIQYGGKTIQDWFDDYIAKELQKGKKRQNIRLPLEKPAQTGQTIKFPFKSKIKAYEQVHGIKLKQEQKATTISVPDYQIKQLPEKFGRPYFSYEFGSWEIDIVFSMNPQLVRINQIYLFCININTKYLVVYPLHSKSQEDIEKALQNLVQTQNVTHIRGDGEKGFASNQLMQFYNKNDIKTYFVNGTKELTNHNRVVDSVIRTIRNAFGQDDRDFANPKLMQQMVDIYNDTPHTAFDNKFTPKQVNSLQELEGYFIRKNDKKLREVKQDQQDQGFTKYLPGNILMIHVDYLRTMHRYMKQRRNFNELAKFIKYDNGNVECLLLKPFTDLDVITVPIYYTKFVCENEQQLNSPQFKKFKDQFLN
ncbi:MAG: hypothetical protein EZS28_038188 [Streblomastix strix]|uniref:Integrase catalytic domain-containing protein n=1 Tax=Streblomastix strix TaxID=222440 RepID=A0A5J4U9C0_9EUKA|nr:MAG: hypothetical protein EZS28_038188 [Streblomastix strix]